MDTSLVSVLCFFFNDTATTEIYTYLHTLSLHDALPILSLRTRALTSSALRVKSSRMRRMRSRWNSSASRASVDRPDCARAVLITLSRSEEHTSELQSLMRISYAVFCLKKKNKKKTKYETEHHRDSKNRAQEL